MSLRVGLPVHVVHECELVEGKIREKVLGIVVAY